MDKYPRQLSESIHRTIAARSGVGPNELISGWQHLLTGLLERMRPYMRAGMTVTFQQMTPEEKRVYENRVLPVSIPTASCGLYLPPSVRNQMMYANRGEPIPDEAHASADDGVLLYTNVNSTSTIVNVLLALPPHTPAIDVYEDGALLAGYVYDSVDSCIDELENVLSIHFGSVNHSETGRSASP